MKKPIALLALTAGALAATPVLAAEPGWTYAQAGYLRADSGDDATDAFRLKGSLGLSDLFHIQAEYVDGSIGFNGPDSDFDGYRVVAGLHPSVGDNTQAVLEVQYFDVTYDDWFDPGEDLDSDGFGVGVGLRHMLTSQLELNARAWWVEGDDEDDVFGDDEDFSDISLDLGGRYYINDAASIGVTVVTNDALVGGDSATIDFRWQFADIL
jgi:hypothetical protein